jgi:hypothetical protein
MAGDEFDVDAAPHPESPAMANNVVDKTIVNLCCLKRESLINFPPF